MTDTHLPVRAGAPGLIFDPAEVSGLGPGEVDLGTLVDRGTSRVVALLPLHGDPAYVRDGLVCLVLPGMVALTGHSTRAAEGPQIAADGLGSLGATVPLCGHASTLHRPNGAARRPGPSTLHPPTWHEVEGRRAGPSSRLPEAGPGGTLPATTPAETTTKRSPVSTDAVEGIRQEDHCGGSPSLGGGFGRGTIRRMATIIAHPETSSITSRSSAPDPSRRAVSGRSSGARRGFSGESWD